MAIFSKGILGGFSGKVGNVIGSSWRGKDVLRSLPTKRNWVATQSQLDQQGQKVFMRMKKLNITVSKALQPKNIILPLTYKKSGYSADFFILCMYCLYHHSPKITLLKLQCLSNGYVLTYPMSGTEVARAWEIRPDKPNWQASAVFWVDHPYFFE